MFVDDDGVEAELIGQHQLGEISLVELMPAFGIVKFVGEVDPRRGNSL